MRRSNKVPTDGNTTRSRGLAPCQLMGDPIMKKMTLSLAALLVLSLPAFAQMAPAKTADTSKGKALVDAKGMTLTY